MAELAFFSGTMDCGKSTLALQLDHNRRARGLRGIVMTAHDRAGESRVSSRLGLVVAAVEVTPSLDIEGLVAARLRAGDLVDYLVCDEAMFYTPEQVEQLARVVDDFGVDVMAFGLTTDFRGRLFPGSARLVELADRFEVLQLEALCWCGARATHNARTRDGVMVTEGETVVVGDVLLQGEPPRPSGVVAYEVLCRRHHRDRTTASVGRVAAPPSGALPIASR